MASPDVPVTIEVGDQSYELLAYEVEDLGVWDAVATDADSAIAAPAADWGADGDHRTAADALAALAAAVVRRAVNRITAGEGASNGKL